MSNIFKYFIKNLLFCYFVIFFYLRSFLKNKNIYFKDNKLKKNWNFFKNNVVINKNITNKKKINILLDSFDNPNWYLSNYFVINYFRSKNIVNVDILDAKRPSEEKNSVDNAIGVNKYIIIKPNFKNLFKINKIYNHLIDKIKNKKDLINYKIDKINFGIDIYESILREGVETVNPKNYLAEKNFFLFALYYVFFTDLVKKTKYHYIMLSHDNYIQYNVPAKLARKNKIQVLLINSRFLVKSKKSFQQFQIFKKYDRILSDLKKKNIFKKLLKKAKKNLNARIAGKLRVDMSYQILSAFHDNKVKQQIKNKINYNILITTHCFYDNPHGYSQLNYCDFWEWMIYLGEISLKSPENFSWYIKPHRDYLPGTIQVIKNFVKKYPNIKMVCPKTSFKQLKLEGLDLILTCHGSIAHEAPLLGIEVINCAYNSGIKFNFAKTILDPKQLERNILLRKKQKYKLNKKELFSFYALHHLYIEANLFWEEFISSSINKENIFLTNYKKLKENTNLINKKINRFLISKIANSKEMK